MKFDKCILVGAGGVGSHLANALVRLLQYHQNGTTNFHIYDLDHFEPKNMNRQLCREEDLQLNKAIALKDQLSFAPDIKAHPKRFDESTVDEALSGSTSMLLILAVDNEATRNRVIQALDYTPTSKNFVCLLPGNGYSSSNTAIYWRINKEKGPIHPFELFSNWAKPTDFLPGGCAEEVESTPQLITANYSAAFSCLLYVQALLEDEPVPPQLIFDAKEFKLQPEGGKPTLPVSLQEKQLSAAKQE